MLEKEKKILITGAAGFIGYHLCEKLLDMKYSIVGLDNINNYYDYNFLTWNEWVNTNYLTDSKFSFNFSSLSNCC